MRLCLELRARPEAESSKLALQLASTWPEASNSSDGLWQVFFVGDAALHADKTHPAGRWRSWQQLAEDRCVELLVCSASAQRLSLLQTEGRFCDSFIPCGLAELAALPADVRLLSFNP